VSEGPSRDGGSPPPAAAEGAAPPPPGHAPQSRPAPRSRGRGPLLVVVAMIVAFVVGVGVATRTELFPPQVAGAAPGSSAPTQGSAGSLRERWRGTMTTTTSQQYSAGFCTTDWRSAIELVVHRGLIRGQGRARLVGRARCPFPTTQPQITGYAFSVTGSVRGSISGSVSGADGFRLSLGGFEPTRGIYDYGGFAVTLADRRTTVDAGLRGRRRAEGRTSSQTRTALGKLVRSRSLVRLACTSCGGA
jgi:hypothetical protein